MKVKMDNNINRGGTSLQGYAPDGTTYIKLVGIFGKPNAETEEFKVDAEWVGEIDGDVFTVYNYKTGKNYLGDDGEDVKDLIGNDWHIGARTEDVANKVVNYIKSF